MHVNILGTRGVPAKHGGFESFAARLSSWLVDRGHSVTVYCQADTGPVGPVIDSWNNVERIHFCPSFKGALGTIQFDFMCVMHVMKRKGVDLVLGYNTAVFCLILKLFGRSVTMNMDGIEWKRLKWGFFAKVWFFINELIGANISNVVIADHPEIARHLRRRTFKKPVVIPYGADAIYDADPVSSTAFDIVSGNYIVSICRLEPENSVLDLVRAFSGVDGDFKLVVLGDLDPCNPYHRAIKDAACDRVIFPGSIYDENLVAALRFGARAYFHGHTVGGTNPSLVEALGAGCAVIAHDNVFNRWVAGNGQFYYKDRQGLERLIAHVFVDDDQWGAARSNARERHREMFLWSSILSQYERVLSSEYERVV